MGIVKPKSGEVITVKSIEDMHLVPKKNVNASSVDYMQDATLGPQHLPSIHHGSASITMGGNVVITNAHTMEYETISDIVSSNWADLMNLDNGGAGYLLPPCKVLVMFEAEVKNITKNTLGASPAPTSDNQAWFAVYWQKLEGGIYKSILGDAAIGMVSAYNPQPMYPLLPQTVREHISIWFIIDTTDLSEPWFLHNIQVRAACGIGSSGAILNAQPDSIEIQNGRLSFCALMRDAT